MGVTAAEILSRSLEDIDNGQWTCHTTGEVGGSGCALGLVMKHGIGDEILGQCQSERIYPQSAELIYQDFGVTITEAQEQAVWDALRALVFSDPETSEAYACNLAFKSLIDGDDEFLTSEQAALVSTTYGYNDSLGSNAPERAREWFSEALATLQTPVTV